MATILLPRLPLPSLRLGITPIFKKQRHLLNFRINKCLSITATEAPQEERQILLQHVTPADLPPGAVISVLTLNRPKANAMGSTMLHQLQESLVELEDSSRTKTRCLIITSCSRKVFSAGADLKERATMSPQQAAAFVTQLRNTMDRLARLPMPVLAAVEGVAVGGGLEIALAADIRIASETAVLGLPETSLAIVPGAGGTQRLPRLIGVSRAKELIFTGRRIDGVTAAEYGLVQHVVKAGQADTFAMELAKQIAKNGPVAIQAAKAAIDDGLAAADMTQALEIECQCYERVLPTADRLEGLAAFKEGRPAVYKGE
jgi:enoyl-CoA hydratase/carnithine racemase